MEEREYDAIVVGGGSSGTAFYRRSREHHSKKVLVVEEREMGGPMTNVKRRLLYELSLKYSSQRNHKGYSITGDSQPFDWEDYRGRVAAETDKIREGLNTAEYGDGLPSFVKGRGEVREGRVEVEGVAYKAKHIVIATGLRVVSGREAEREGRGEDLEAIFDLECQPKSISIAGGDKESVEVASLFLDIGTEVFLCTEEILSLYDPSIRESVYTSLKRRGLKTGRSDGALYVKKKRAPAYSPPSPSSFTLHTIGSLSISPSLIKEREGGYTIDKNLSTYTGHRLADRIFASATPSSPFQKKHVPIILFTNPPSATVGLSLTLSAVKGEGGEEQENLEEVKTKFRGLFYSVLEESDKVATEYRIVRTKGSPDRVVGIHISGDASEEIIQGFSLSLSMGISTADLLQTIPIHPTSAEELITG